MKTSDYTADTRCGHLTILPCQHVEDDAEVMDMAGYYDVNMFDFYGLTVTVAELPSHTEAVGFVAVFDPHVTANGEWFRYVMPYDEVQEQEWRIALLVEQHPQEALAFDVSISDLEGAVSDVRHMQRIDRRVEIPRLTSKATEIATDLVDNHNQLTPVFKPRLLQIRDDIKALL